MKHDKPSVYRENMHDTWKINVKRNGEVVDSGFRYDTHAEAHEVASQIDGAFVVPCYVMDEA